jgi:hypothetical protein
MAHLGCKVFRSKMGSSSGIVRDTAIYWIVKIVLPITYLNDFKVLGESERISFVTCGIK